MTAIVADSSVYLTRAEAEKLGVRIVPMTYSVEGGGLYAEDFVDANGQYEALVAQNIGRMHTSQATMSAFMMLNGATRESTKDAISLFA